MHALGFEARFENQIAIPESVVQVDLVYSLDNQCTDRNYSRDSPPLTV